MHACLIIIRIAALLIIEPLATTYTFYLLHYQYQKKKKGPKKLKFLKSGTQHKHHFKICHAWLILVVCYLGPLSIAEDNKTTPQKKFHQ